MDEGETGLAAARLLLLLLALPERTLDGPMGECNLRRDDDEETLEAAARLFAFGGDHS